MGKLLDELAKSLASGMSRREALRRFAAGVTGVTLAGAAPSIAGAQPGGNKECVRICKQLYPEGEERGACISRSAKCPRGQCSPFTMNEGQSLCIPAEHCM